MLARFRDRLTYANVVATLALFVALGGTGYASHLITSKDIKNRTIKGGDVRKNALGGTEINESKMKTVPSALRAQSAAGADVSKNAETANQAANSLNADVANLARDAQTLAGQGASAFEGSSAVQFGSASAAPAGTSGETVVLAWPEMGIEVTSSSPAGAPAGCDPAVAIRNTKSSGPSALVFEDGQAGPVVAPGGKGYECLSNDGFDGQVTDSTNRTLFVNCVVAQGQLRCLGIRSDT